MCGGRGARWSLAVVEEHCRLGDQVLVLLPSILPDSFFLDPFGCLPFSSLQCDYWPHLDRLARMHRRSQRPSAIQFKFPRRSDFF